MTDFYVYLHKKKTTGEIFYVGKGSGRRAYDFKLRNAFWKRVEAKYGCDVEIYMDNLQEWYALELETQLIAYYGRKDLGLGELTNLSDGGELPAKGVKLTEEQRQERSIRSLGLNNACADRNIYTFVNIFNRERYTGTRYDHQAKYGVEVKGLFRKITHLVAHGWCLEKNFEKIVNGGYNKDTNTYKFAHEDGRTFEGSRSHFIKEYSIDPGPLFRKNVCFCQGWYIDNGKVKISRTDKTVYTLFNEKTNEIFIGRRMEFKSKYSENIDGLFFPGGRSVVSKGWSIVGSGSSKVFHEYLLHSNKTDEFFSGSREDFNKKYKGIDKQLFAESNTSRTQSWKVIEKRPFCLYIP